MKNVLVLKGESRFNVLRKATDEIAQGFRNKGYEVCILDLTIDEEKSKLKSHIFQPYSFVFSCQALLLDTLCDDGIPLMSKIGKPMIGWIFDDCIYHDFRLKNCHYDNTYVLMVNGTNVENMQMMYPATKNMYYLPHGGFCGEENVEKDIDILVSGNLGKEPVFEDKYDDIMPIERYLVTESIKILESNPTLSVRQALK